MMQGRAAVTLINGDELVGDVMWDTTTLTVVDGMLYSKADESTDNESGQFTVPHSSVLMVRWVDKQVFTANTRG